MAWCPLTFPNPPTREREGRVNYLFPSLFGNCLKRILNQNVDMDQMKMDKIDLTISRKILKGKRSIVLVESRNPVLGNGDALKNTSFLSVRYPVAVNILRTLRLAEEERPERRALLRKRRKWCGGGTTEEPFPCTTMSMVRPSSPRLDPECIGVQC